MTGVLSCAGAFPLSTLPTSLETLSINSYDDRFFLTRKTANKFEGTYQIGSLSRLTNLKVLKMAQCQLEGDATNFLNLLGGAGYIHVELRGNTGIILTGSLCNWLVMNHLDLRTLTKLDLTGKGLTGEACVVVCSCTRCSRFEVLSHAAHAFF